MTIALKPEHERFITDQVTAGRFGSAEDAVAEALDRLMGEAEPTAEDLAAVREGLDQLGRGEGVPWERARPQLVGKYGLDR